MYTNLLTQYILTITLINLIRPQFQIITTNLNLNSNPYENLKTYLNDSTKKFIHNFFKYSNFTSCNIDEYLNEIYQHSFNINNYLGDFNGCSKIKNMRYLHLIYIKLLEENHYDQDNNLIIDKNKFNRNFYDNNLSYYFKDLIFTEYQQFGICVPQCVNYINNITISNPFKNDNENSTYLANVYDINTVLSNQIKEKGNMEFYLSIIFLLLFALSLFFAIFSDLSRCCCCKRKDNISNNSYQTFSNSEDEGEEERKDEGEDEVKEQNNNQNNNHSKDKKRISNKSIILNDIKYLSFSHKENKCLKFYKFLSSIFSMTKNYNRIIKDTSGKNKVHSSYVNDHSLGFINGMKGINLLCFIYCSFLWTFLTSPNVIVKNINKKEELLKQGAALFILFFGHIFFHLYFAINGFILSFKFLSHINNNKVNSLINSNSNRKPKSKLVLFIGFILSQFYFYIVLIILLITVSNLEIIFNMTNTFTNKSQQNLSENSPLFYIYKDASLYNIKNYFVSFLVLQNGLGIDYFLKNGFIFTFFYISINEIQYFFISIFLLIMYQTKNKIGLFLSIITYFSALGGRIINLIYFNEKDFAFRGDIFNFIEISSFKFLSGFPVYVIGVFFGLVYYEYYNSNKMKINYHVNNNVAHTSFFSSSDESRLSYSEMELKKDYKFINLIKFTDTRLIIIISIITFVLASLFIYFTVILIPNIQKYGLSNYKFNYIDKICTVLAIDLFIIWTFLIICKFVIFSSSNLKIFLTNRLWIPLARLYFPTACLVYPLSYCFLFSLTYPLSFGYITFLYFILPIMFMLFILAFFVTLIVNVPLKVGIKKIINKFVYNK